MQKFCALVLALLLPLVTGAPMARAASQEVITGPRQLSQPASPILDHWNCLNGCSHTLIAGKKTYLWTYYEIQPSTDCHVLFDSQGNTWTPLTSAVPGFPNMNTFVTVPAVTGVDTIGMSTAPCFFIGVILNSTSGFDVGAGNACICAPGIISTSITTTANNDLLFAGVGAIQNSFAWTIDPPSEPGWVFLDGTGTGFAGAQARLFYKKASTAGGYSATIHDGLGTVITWATLDSFKP